jgi:beta-galactosidase
MISFEIRLFVPSIQQAPFSSMQDAECELLIKRDRNHPSVVIWSLCNEVLCNTNDWVNDALRLKALIRRLDPRGARPVSANQNGWIGPHTPLDLQGFDYATGSYDGWHRDAPNIPSISSETSSAVSDRGEYVNNETAGYVSGYDNNYPGWGESAEQAWGGVGVGGGQGILTRPFISGGWTWTGWDYKGEPTPYAWPDINSHFGILDIAGFPKDRFYWYRAWFVPDTSSSWLFPHWSWDNQNFNLPVWVYSNGDEVELFVNGKSQGRKSMPKFGHVEWSGVKYQPGSLKAVSYKRGVISSVVYRNTTSEPAALRLSIKDGVGATLAAGCKDVALLQVEVVDQNGAVVPDASNEVTFSVTGAGELTGTGNGDPACHVSDKSATRPAYHGLVLGVVQAGSSTGTITVSATAPGLRAATPVTLTVGPHPTAWSYWCHVGPSL